MISYDCHVEQDKAIEFMLAGKAEFILHSTKTNDNFKYKVERKVKREGNSNHNKGKEKQDDNDFIYFVHIFENHNKTYAGFIVFDKKTGNFNYYKGKAGNIDGTDIRIRSLVFILNKLVREQIVEHLIIFHTGYCGKCGKKLTTVESILTGLGPVCSKRLNIPRVKINKGGL